MFNFSQSLSTKLNGLNQRRLEKGEIFLLAKAIADKLPLAPSDTDNMNIFIISQRSFIDQVVYVVNKYSYIDEDTTKYLISLIRGLSLWRYNIAYNPPSVFFKGDTNCVIDDISCLARYVEVKDMCSVADIMDKANVMYLMFKELATVIKTESPNSGNTVN